MNEIEGHVRGPTAAAPQLMGLLSNMSSTTIDAPRKFSSDMMTKLDLIAQSNGGVVPIHGRLFAQWLHYAFPHECPLPTAAGALTPSAWLNGAAIGSAEEREQHIKQADAAQVSGEHVEVSWSEEEILPFEEPRRKERGAFASFFRFAMMVSAILFVFKAAYSNLQTAVSAHQGTEWKDKKCAL